MFGVLVKREILSHLRSLRFSTSLILCFTVMIVSIYLLADDQPEAQPDAVGVYSPSLSHLARWGPIIFRFRHPPALRVLCRGLGDEMAAVALAPAYNQPEYIQGDFARNPVPVLFPSIDFCFIVSLVTSLIAIIFTYDSIAGEKQRGTLRLILSNSVPRYHVLSAKWLGSFLSFLIGYVPGLLVVALFVELHPAIMLDTTDYVSIFVIDVLSILYVACFFSLGLLVSCRCSEPRTSLILLLMLWTLLILIIPSFTAYSGVILRPTPAPYAIEKQIREIQREEYVRAWERTQLYKEQGESIQSGRQVSELRSYQNQIVWEEIQNVQRRVSRVRNPYTQKLHQQVQLSQVMSYLSPLPAFVYLISDLCYTGNLGDWHFRRSVDRYQSELMNYLHERLKVAELSSQPDLDMLPEFGYRELGISEIVQIHWASLVCLVLYPILFFLGAYFSFLKYDVR